MRVPFADLAAQEATVAPEVLAAVAEVAREARFILGPRVERFERWLADACGAEHAAGVASGSDALELALRALGVGPGDAVVTPALSFIATAEAIVAAGARPVFCDIEPETMIVSKLTIAAALDRAASAGLRVRALLPVHLFGMAAPLAELQTLSGPDGARLALVEDAAQAIGARDADGRPCGGIGDAGCFSFFPSKNLGAWGDGGAVVTNRAEVLARVRSLRAHGVVAPYIHAELGRNSRLDALQAAVLTAKAPHLGAWNAARAAIARRYLTGLAGLPLVLPVDPPPPAVHAWHAFVVRVADPARRDALVRALAQDGVEARVYYPKTLSAQECFAALHEPAMPAAEAVCRAAVALPIFTALRADSQDYVIARIARFFRG